MIESKKQFKVETWCAAVGCPFKGECKLSTVDKTQARELIRAVQKNGKCHLKK